MINIIISSESLTTVNEAKERILSPYDESLRQKFIKNDEFQRMFMNKLITDLFVPILKRIMTREEILDALKFIKRFSKFFEKDRSIPYKFYDLERKYISNPFSKNIMYIIQDVLPHIKDTFLFMDVGGKISSNRKILLYYMIHKKFPSDPELERFSFHLPDFYKLLYSYGDQLSVPIVKRIGPNDSEKSFLQLNLELLKKDYDFLDEESIKNIDILSHFELGNELGRGAFGIVYDIKNANRALKIFSRSISLKADIKRINTVLEQLFDKKEAKVEDMHYFDHGTITRKGTGQPLYYAVMPLIVPLSSTDEFKKNKNVYSILSDVIHDIGNSKRGTMSFDEYVKLIKYKLDQRLFLDWGGAYPDRADPVKIIPADQFTSIMNAAYRAIEEFGGDDLHLWNIGFLKQKPDVYFFYDM